VAKLKNGIVLVTGPTGSGKSTTLAAIINRSTTSSAYHIITIEDPVEYMHRHVRSTVNQREVGSDTKSFARAARRPPSGTEGDPHRRDARRRDDRDRDGSGRDGPPGLSTLHTIDAAKTVDRIIGVFPKEQEPQIRTRFSQSFRYVISQRLRRRSAAAGSPCSRS
jgi:twitching motility protein PilT